MFQRRRWAAASALATALATGVATALATGVAIVAGPAWAATGWTVVSVPQTGNNTELNGAFALSNSNAWAVGVQFGAAGQAPPPPVAYHWNGSAWSLTATPSLGVNGSLTAVSAISASDAWAVGFTTQSGYHGTLALYEHWNGSTWSVVAGPGSGLNAVADLSASNAWAVGTGGVVDQWNGTAWNSVTVPVPNPSDTAGDNLTAITAISASDIWAVGEFTNTSFTNSAYALHYNGTAWTVTILPQPNVSGPSSPVLHGVTAVASNNVWAVGENEEVPGLGITTLIEHWNGSAWSIVASPTPGAYPILNAVAARSASDVYAVGSNSPSVNGGVQQGLIMRWNGSTWSADTDPTSGTYSPLYGAATFPGAASEWAVGINSADQALVLSHG
jgi:hypothetical protein